MDSLEIAANAATWRVDWAWSLPLIVLTVVIHVFGLGLMHERVVHVVSRLVERRHFAMLFAGVMGVAVLLATMLHAIEGGVWAAVYWLLGALPDVRSSTLFSFGAMTTYGGSNFNLKHPLAADGSAGGAEPDHSARPDHRVSVLDDPGGLAGRRPGETATALI